MIKLFIILYGMEQPKRWSTTATAAAGGAENHLLANGHAPAGSSGALPPFNRLQRCLRNRPSLRLTYAGRKRRIQHVCNFHARELEDIYPDNSDGSRSTLQGLSFPLLKVVLLFFFFT